MLTDVISLWENLRAECEVSGQTLERLVRADSPSEIVLRKGPNVCSLLVGTTAKDNLGRVEQIPACMTYSPAKLNSGEGIEIRLRDNRYEKIFVWFSQDLANRLDECLASDMADALEVCFAEWADAFRVLPESGMSREAQQGLFAELFFLKEVLSSEGIEKAILGWKSQNSLHDFQIGDAAWEIKSFGGRRREVKISSEDQLETTGLSELYLVAIGLKVSEVAGTSVADIVEQVLDLIDGNAELLIHFRTGLARYGYLNESSIHNVFYFAPKSLAQYRVSSDFPRITSSNLPSAVHNVRYGLSLASLEQHVAEPIVIYDDS